MNNKTVRGKENLVKKLKLQCKNSQTDKNLKSAHGITLVALVITIIIIIILASITMNMAFGDNGLIKQAQLAKDMAANSVIAEQEGMNSLMGEFANTMGGNEIDNPTDPDPEEPDPEPGPGEEIPEGTITFGEVVWSGYRASVEVKSSALNSKANNTNTSNTNISTLNSSEASVENSNGASISKTSESKGSSTDIKYTIQYQVNGQVDNQWKTINNGESVENLYHGDKVYARLTDGEKASQAQEKQVLDTKAPAKATIKLNKENLVAGESLTAKVTHIDNESGVDLAQSKWILNQTASEIGIDAGSYTGIFSSNEETITLNSSTTGEYYLHILTVDKGGNKTETISNKITIGNITGTVQQKGETTWSGGHASIELETTETGFTIEYKINNGSWTNYSGKITNLNHGDKVTARLTNGTSTGPETTIEIKDENNPVVIVTAGGTTTNSVTVSVSASDNESGMAENVTYTYYIKKTSEGDGSYNAPNGATNITQTNYTFTNLDQGTSYDVKVEAKADKAGNIGTGSLLNQTTATIGGASEGLEEGNIVAGPVTWKNEKASTTLTTSTSLQIQYQINNTTEGKWQTISNGGTVGNLNHGDTVFARLYDGKNHGDYASVNILDGIAPTVQISVGETTSNSIQVSATANDGQSGLATNNTYKYYLNNSLKKTTTETSYTFTGLTDGTNYEIKVEAYDKANNKGMDTENVSTIPFEPQPTPEPEQGNTNFSSTDIKNGVIEIKWLSGTSNKVSETPNAPQVKTISNGTMELVRYTGEGSTEKERWVAGTEYSYLPGEGSSDNTTSKWANARVTIDGIDSYFVWIPRYAYRIIYFDSAESKKAYQEGTLTEEEAKAQGKIKGYSDSRGIVDSEGKKVVNVTSTAKEMVSEDYFMTHPAFLADADVGGGFGNNNGTNDNGISGIWIGKYETSGSSSQLKVQPNVDSLSSVNIGNMYTYAKAYSTELESHMLKNSEWGAVAYLTESKYGRNGTEIDMNTTSFTGGNWSNGYVINTRQSTTGNVYGIYDMRGGTGEYVASYYTGGKSTYLNNGSSFTNTKTSDKYATAYTEESVSIGYKYGDATYETSGWHSDGTFFVYSYYPFFDRGGEADSIITSDTGVFYSDINSGKAFSTFTFRIALSIK